MEFQTTDRLEITEDILSQEVNGETVLRDLNGETYFGLNEVGTRIWQLLQAKPTLQDMLGVLLDEYDVSRKQLENDVGDLLTRLAGAGLITRLD